MGAGTDVSTLAVLLVLVSWLAVLGTWNFGPVNQLPPEQDIEPGEAFGDQPRGAARAPPGPLRVVP